MRPRRPGDELRRRPLRRHVRRRHVFGRVLRKRSAQGCRSRAWRASRRRARTRRSSRDVLAWSAAEPDGLAKSLAASRTNGTRTTSAPTAPEPPFNIDAKLNGAYRRLWACSTARGIGNRRSRSPTRCGQDSDCNPASALGVLGAMLRLRHDPRGLEVRHSCSRGPRVRLHEVLVQRDRREHPDPSLPGDRGCRRVRERGRDRRASTGARGARSGAVARGRSRQADRPRGFGLGL